LIAHAAVREEGTLTTRVALPSAMALMRSGGTLVTMSASPLSSATKRGKSSGMGFQITRSMAGFFPSQPHQSRLASMTSRSSLTHSTKRYAPVPTGLRASSLAPSSVVKRAGTICDPICAMRTGSRGSGFLVMMRTTPGVGTCTASMVAKPAVTPVRPGIRLRSSVAFTSSAARGAPSWNFTPGRSVNSHVVSLTARHDVARAGWSARDPSQRVSES
jgi:hypothetical protein